VGRTAREEAFRAGVPVVFLKDGQLVWLHPDGTETIHSTDAPVSDSKPEEQP
jgi:hypothetical protein